MGMTQKSGSTSPEAVVPATSGISQSFRKMQFYRFRLTIKLYSNAMLWQ
jgi:hypothetical protein